MAIEVGMILEGKVSGITKFGAFVDLPESKTGMVHISEVAPTFINEISDYVKVGQEVKVKVLAINDGKISLSMKQALPKDMQHQKNTRKPSQNRSRQPYKPAPPVKSPGDYEWQSSRKSSPSTFEDMMSRFKQTSEDKMSDLKRGGESRFNKGGKFMKITYTARKVNLRDNFKERVEKKLTKFKKLFSDSAAVNVVVTLEKNRQTVEITIRDKGMVFRAESTMPEMNDALDRTVDILMRQIRKNKTKLEKRIKSGSLDDFVQDTHEITEEPIDEYQVIRKKQILVKPISVDEAILEMNMVNHDFFMFINAGTWLTTISSCSSTPKQTKSTLFISARTETTVCSSQHQMNN